MKHLSPIRLALIPALAILSTLASAKAATVSWDGDQNPNLLWSTNANWVGGTAPASDLTTDTALYTTDAIAGNRTPNLDSDRQITGVTFATSGYVLGSSGGFTLSVGNSGITVNSNQSATINHNISSANTTANNFINIFSNSTLTLGASSTMNLNGIGNNITTVNAGLGAQVISNGAIVANSISGAGSNSRLQKSGVGTWTINSANNNVTSGATSLARVQLNAGTIELGASGALGTANIVSVSGGNVQTLLMTTAGSVTANKIQFFDGTAGAVHTIGGTNATGTVTYNSGSNTLDISNGDSSGTGTQLLTQFTAASGGRVNFESTIANLATGTPSRNGGINKIGAGTVALSGNNTYSLGTVVSEGTLLVNNSAGSGVGNGSVSVASGATLGGTGFLVPTGVNAITVSGDLAPGDGGTGTLTVNSGSSSATSVLSFTSGAHIKMDLNSGFTSDRIALVSGSAGDISFLNTVIEFTDLSGGTLASGIYTLFTSDAAGAYSGLTTFGNTITGGLSFTGLSGYAGTLGLQGNNIVLTLAVPEPSTSILAGLGLVVMLSRFRRRVA